MNILSDLLALLLLFYTGGILGSKLQRCSSDSECQGVLVCCFRTCINPKYDHCKDNCNVDSDCRPGESCKDYFCRVPLSPSWRRFTLSTSRNFALPTTETSLNYECALDSDCSDSRVCDDGKCVFNSSGSSWNGLQLAGILVFVILATVVACLVQIWRRTRKPSVISQQTSVHEIANQTNAPELGSAVAAANVAAVDIEEEFPFPAGAPPPYNSLGFNTEGETPLEAPPPSYDEAVRNSNAGRA